MTHLFALGLEVALVGGFGGDLGGDALDDLDSGEFEGVDLGGVVGDEADGVDADVTKILVLPALPTAEPFRSQSVEMLKEKGVDGILSFRSMLLDLIEKIDSNRNYGKSDTLQVIRVLKNYDLLKDAQLDLLSDRMQSARRARSAPAESTGP